MKTHSNEAKINLGLHPNTFFGRAPSLQNLIFEKLCKEKGGLENFLHYLKTDKIIMETTLAPEREGLRIAFRDWLHKLLLQATIDDDRQTVKTILDCEPQLLLADPSVNEIESKHSWQKSSTKPVLLMGEKGSDSIDNGIESKYTRQKFSTEPAFLMAQKLRRLEITKIMFPYFEQLASEAKENKTADQTEDPNQYWALPLSLKKAEQQKNEKLQEEYIKDYIEPLIKWVETRWEESPSTIFGEIISMVKAFRKILLFPDKAIIIGDYIDMEQLLIASYKVLNRSFERFSKNSFLRLFVNLITYSIQSVIPPTLAKAYDTRVSKVVKDRNSWDWDDESSNPIIKQEFIAQIDKALDHLYQARTMEFSVLTERVHAKMYCTSSLTKKY